MYHNFPGHAVFESATVLCEQNCISCPPLSCSHCPVFIDSCFACRLPVEAGAHPQSLDMLQFSPTEHSTCLPANRKSHIRNAKNATGDLPSNFSLQSMPGRDCSISCPSYDRLNLPTKTSKVWRNRRETVWDFRSGTAFLPLPFDTGTSFVGEWRL